MPSLATTLHPLLRLLTFGVGLSAWGAALYGSTQLHQAQLAIGHGICGPWGCAAAPEALLGYHLLLLTLIVPTVVLVGQWLSSEANVRLGRWATLIGGFGALLLMAWATATWITDGSAPQYALQRGLFVVATTPDLPVAQLLIAGLATWGIAQRRRDGGQLLRKDGQEANASLQ